ncbi:hypothetical protein LAJ19_09815 [Deinococcus taeanensis]|uniref:DoxX family protein n=1 Tax=Deinococcus taeanensis TaxID=2737050 RepID=UPI001CDD173A|nr:hypothetical protein [Deinococcus taeanensis]UBV41936.1 hypothetical protein LAJ19_09815 [Deinococcus taeanensis]
MLTPDRALPRLTPGVLLLATLFITAGALHFITPRFFDRIVPPWVPMTPRAATLLSGAAELMGGLGLLHPATRPAARWGLLALLAAVFPANVWMAQDPERFRVSPAVAWGRLPLQPLLLWAVWRAGRPGLSNSRERHH